VLAILFLIPLPNVKAATDQQPPKVGPVKLNPHPVNLEGKTVLLRWNGKYNGDKFLDRLAELLTQKVKKITVIKLWEADSTTAAISKTAEISEEIASKVANLHPDLVIAAQAD
jgi:hypothetical protein